MVSSSAVAAAAGDSAASTSSSQQQATTSMISTVPAAVPSSSSAYAADSIQFSRKRQRQQHSRQNSWPSCAVVSNSTTNMLTTSSSNEVMQHLVQDLYDRNDAYTNTLLSLTRERLALQSEICRLRAVAVAAAKKARHQEEEDLVSRTRYYEQQLEDDNSDLRKQLQRLEIILRDHGYSSDGHPFLCDRSRKGGGGGGGGGEQPAEIMMSVMGMDPERSTVLTNYLDNKIVELYEEMDEREDENDRLVARVEELDSMVANLQKKRYTTTAATAANSLMGHDGDGDDDKAKPISTRSSSVEENAEHVNEGRDHQDECQESDDEPVARQLLKSVGTDSEALAVPLEKRGSLAEDYEKLQADNQGLVLRNSQLREKASELEGIVSDLRGVESSLTRRIAELEEQLDQKQRQTREKEELHEQEIWKLKKCLIEVENENEVLYEYQQQGQTPEEESESSLPFETDTTIGSEPPAEKKVLRKSPRRSSLGDRLKVVDKISGHDVDDDEDESVSTPWTAPSMAVSMAHSSVVDTSESSLEVPLHPGREWVSGGSSSRGCNISLSSWGVLSMTRTPTKRAKRRRLKALVNSLPSEANLVESFHQSFEDLTKSFEADNLDDILKNAATLYHDFNAHVDAGGLVGFGGHKSMDDLIKPIIGHRKKTRRFSDGGASPVLRLREGGVEADGESEVHSDPLEQTARILAADEEIIEIVEHAENQLGYELADDLVTVLRDAAVEMVNAIEPAPPLSSQSSELDNHHPVATRIIGYVLIDEVEKLRGESLPREIVSLLRAASQWHIENSRRELQSVEMMKERLDREFLDALIETAELQLNYPFPDDLSVALRTAALSFDSLLEESIDEADYHHSIRIDFQELDNLFKKAQKVHASSFPMGILVALRKAGFVLQSRLEGTACKHQNEAVEGDGFSSVESAGTYDLDIEDERSGDVISGPQLNSSNPDLRLPEKSDVSGTARSNSYDDHSVADVNPPSLQDGLSSRASQLKSSIPPSNCTQNNGQSYDGEKIRLKHPERADSPSTQSSSEPVDRYESETAPIFQEGSAKRKQEPTPAADGLGKRESGVGVHELEEESEENKSADTSRVSEVSLDLFAVFNLRNNRSQLEGKLKHLECGGRKNLLQKNLLTALEVTSDTNNCHNQPSIQPTTPREPGSGRILVAAAESSETPRSTLQSKGADSAMKELDESTNPNNLAGQAGSDDLDEIFKHAVTAVDLGRKVTEHASEGSSSSLMSTYHASSSALAQNTGSLTMHSSSSIVSSTHLHRTKTVGSILESIITDTEETYGIEVPTDTIEAIKTACSRSVVGASLTAVIGALHNDTLWIDAEKVNGKLIPSDLIDAIRSTSLPPGLSAQSLAVGNDIGIVKREAADTSSHAVHDYSLNGKSVDRELFPPPLATTSMRSDNSWGVLSLPDSGQNISPAEVVEGLSASPKSEELQLRPALSARDRKRRTEVKLGNSLAGFGGGSPDDLKELFYHAKQSLHMYSPMIPNQKQPVNTTVFKPPAVTTIASKGFKGMSEDSLSNCSSNSSAPYPDQLEAPNREKMLTGSTGVDNNMNHIPAQSLLRATEDQVKCLEVDVLTEDQPEDRAKSPSPDNLQDLFKTAYPQSPRVVLSSPAPLQKSPPIPPDFNALSKAASQKKILAAAKVDKTPTSPTLRLSLPATRRGSFEKLLSVTLGEEDDLGLMYQAAYSKSPIDDNSPQPLVTSKSPPKPGLELMRTNKYFVSMDHLKSPDMKNRTPILSKFLELNRHELLERTQSGRELPALSPVTEPTMGTEGGLSMMEEARTRLRALREAIPDLEPEQEENESEMEDLVDKARLKMEERSLDTVDELERIIAEARKEYGFSELSTELIDAMKHSSFHELNEASMHDSNLSSLAMSLIDVDKCNTDLTVNESSLKDLAAELINDRSKEGDSSLDPLVFEEGRNLAHDSSSHTRTRSTEWTVEDYMAALIDQAQGELEHPLERAIVEGMCESVLAVCSATKTMICWDDLEPILQEVCDEYDEETWFETQEAFFRAWEKCADPNLRQKLSQSGHASGYFSAISESDGSVSVLMDRSGDFVPMQDVIDEVKELHGRVPSVLLERLQEQEDGTAGESSGFEYSNDFGNSKTSLGLKSSAQSLNYEYSQSTFSSNNLPLQQDMSQFSFDADKAKHGLMTTMEDEMQEKRTNESSRPSSMVSSMSSEPRSTCFESSEEFSVWTRDEVDEGGEKDWDAESDSETVEEDRETITSSSSQIVKRDEVAKDPPAGALSAVPGPPERSMSAQSTLSSQSGHSVTVNMQMGPSILKEVRKMFATQIPEDLVFVLKHSSAIPYSMNSDEDISIILKECESLGGQRLAADLVLALREASVSLRTPSNSRRSRRSRLIRQSSGSFRSRTSGMPSIKETDDVSPSSPKRKYTDIVPGEITMGSSQYFSGARPASRRDSIDPGLPETFDPAVSSGSLSAGFLPSNSLDDDGTKSDGSVHGGSVCSLNMRTVFAPSPRPTPTSSSGFNESQATQLVSNTNFPAQPLLVDDLTTVESTSADSTTVHYTDGTSHLRDNLNASDHTAETSNVSRHLSDSVSSLGTSQSSKYSSIEYLYESEKAVDNEHDAGSSSTTTAMSVSRASSLPSKKLPIGVDVTPPLEGVETDDLATIFKIAARRSSC